MCAWKGLKSQGKSRLTFKNNSWNILTVIKKIGYIIYNNCSNKRVRL
jgi:hypothetical protein